MKKFIALTMCTILSAAMICSMSFADEAQEDAPEILEDAVVVEEDIVSPEDNFAGSMEAVEPELITVAPELSENGEIIIGDYSTIEIPSNEVEVTDEEVDSYIESILYYETYTEQITEGTVESGDTVNIDFSGKIAGEEEPFDGGTAQGYDLILGSGMFIPGFEEQIMGHEIGETFDINVTFPDDYAEELAGKDAVFTITINYKSQEVTPELNDEFVKTFSAENLQETLETVDELKAYTYDYLYTLKLDALIMQKLQEISEPVSYNESQFELIKQYFMESLEYNAQMYAAYGMEGYDADFIAQMNGFADADSYAADQAVYYLDFIMLMDNVANEKGIEITDEEVDEMIQIFMQEGGYDSMYSVEEFKEMSGEAWVLLYTKMNVEYEKVMESLHENVVFVEPVDAGAEVTEVSENN